MKHELNKTHHSVGAAARFMNRFSRQEDGLMTIMACFMIMILVVVGGIGVDLMRNEMERTRLQAVSDRAVLAAADLDQTLDPEAVVRDYFDKSGMAGYVSSVEVDEGLNFRTVTVNASTTMNTQFMKTLGVPTLVVPAKSTAEERVNKVEISLVLDISGSMKDNNKMPLLKTASKAFVDAVLKPSNADLISVSMVPYSQHVNVGPDIFDRLNVEQVHNYSHCIEMSDSEYDTVVLNKTQTYQQMQHFQWNYYSNQSGSTQNTRYDTMCPRYSYERIIPFSQNATFIKQQIEKLKPRAGTQIFMGMKWAAAMLDPSFRSITTSLANASKVDDVFANRPVDYSDDETLKTIVLMTDGKNSSASRIASRYYNSDSEIVHWNNYNFQYYLNRYVSYDRRQYFYWNKYTASQGDTLLYNMCDAAKEKRIIIWSIGFEVDDHGADVMKYCASSPSHFFRVEGVDINKAFEAIARQINQLRLTQ